MEHDTLTLLLALVAIIAGFGTALGFVVRKLMDRNDKLIAAWQEAQSKQHLEQKRTVDALADAVREFKEWRTSQTRVQCDMDKVHDELVSHMQSLTSAMAELMALAQRTHAIIEQINGRLKV